MLLRRPGAIALIMVAIWLYQKDSNVLALICLIAGLALAAADVIELVEAVPF